MDVLSLYWPSSRCTYGNRHELRYLSNHCSANSLMQVSKALVPNMFSYAPVICIVTVEVSWEASVSKTLFTVLHWTMKWCKNQDKHHWKHHDEAFLHDEANEMCRAVVLWPHLYIWWLKKLWTSADNSSVSLWTYLCLWRSWGSPGLSVDVSSSLRFQTSGFKPHFARSMSCWMVSLCLCPRLWGPWLIWGSDAPLLLVWPLLISPNSRLSPGNKENIKYVAI